MSKFFISRPIVAMVISILLVIVGAVTIAGLPVAQFPAIAPPEVQIQANYVGADAQNSVRRRKRHPLPQWGSRAIIVGSMAPSTSTPCVSLNVP